MSLLDLRKRTARRTFGIERLRPEQKSAMVASSTDATHSSRFRQVLESTSLSSSGDDLDGDRDAARPRRYRRTASLAGSGRAGCSGPLRKTCAAQQLGRTSQDSEAYACDLVAVDLANPNPDMAIERIVADLGSRGITQQEVRRVMDQFPAQAEGAVRGSSSGARNYGRED